MAEKFHWRALTEHDLLRARGLGADALAHWRAGDQAHLQRMFFNFALGGAIPVIGCIFLGWSTTLVGVALSLDVITAWVCDVIKVMLAREQVAYQVDWNEKVSEIVHVANALRSPRTPPGQDMPLLLYPEFRRDNDSVIQWLVLSLFLVVFAATLTMLFMLYTIVRPADDTSINAASLALLAATVVTRLLLTARVALSLRTLPGSHAELSPQSMIPAAALLGALVIWIIFEANFFTVNAMQRYGGVTFVAVYCMVALLAGTLARSVLLRRVHTIKTLLAGDQQQQLARIRHFEAAAKTR
jgi:hypothetical protein